MYTVYVYSAQNVALSFPFQAAIRKELNEFKSSEMEVHEDSKIYTRSGTLDFLAVQ